MNEYKVTYETEMSRHFSFIESWRLEADTKDEAKERVLAVHPASNILSVRKMPYKQ